MILPEYSRFRGAARRVGTLALLEATEGALARALPEGALPGVGHPVPPKT